MSDVPLIPRRWSDVDISGIEGKKFFITGGTSGLGKESAAALNSTWCSRENYCS